MNMFWKKSKSSQPETGEPVKAKLWDIFRKSDQGDRFTLDDLTERAALPRRDVVAFWLGELASAHLIDQFVMVISPKNSGGIRRYESIDEVPSEIFDPYQLKDIPVEPDLIRIYFTKHSESAGVVGNNADAQVLM